jgi:hypothetical protein
VQTHPFSVTWPTLLAADRDQPVRHDRPDRLGSAPDRPRRPWSIGLLDAQTGSYPLDVFGEQPEDNWAVVRLKRNLGQRSNVGFIATNRDQDGVGTNRVLGLDGSFKPNQNTTLAGFYTSSETDREQFLGSEPVTDWAGGAQAVWEGPTSSYAFDFLQIGEDYNPEAGFLLRSNIRRYVSRFSLNPRPATQGRVRNYHYAVTGDIITDLDNDADGPGGGRPLRARTCTLGWYRVATQSTSIPRTRARALINA